MLRPLLKRTVFFVLVASAVACAPSYDRLDITPVKGQGVLGGNVDRSQLVVAEGLPITVQVVARDDRNDPMSLALVSEDPSVVEVAAAVNEHTYAFLGKKVGTTLVRVLVDDDIVLKIPATVVAQPTP